MDYFTTTPSSSHPLPTEAIRTAMMSSRSSRKQASSQGEEAYRSSSEMASKVETRKRTASEITTTGSAAPKSRVATSSLESHFKPTALRRALRSSPSMNFEPMATPLTFGPASSPSDPVSATPRPQSRNGNTTHLDLLHLSTNLDHTPSLNNTSSSTLSRSSSGASNNTLKLSATRQRSSSLLSNQGPTSPRRADHSFAASRVSSGQSTPLFLNDPIPDNRTQEEIMTSVFKLIPPDYVDCPRCGTKRSCRRLGVIWGEYAYDCIRTECKGSTTRAVPVG